MTTIGSTGVASGIDWNSLIQAVLQQDGLPVQQMQNQQTANNNRIAAFQKLQSDMTSLSTSLSTLGGISFNARTVTSSDTAGTYVTASASGAATGAYSVQVAQIATAGKISPTMSGGAPTNLSVTDPLATPIFSGSSASFAIQGTDGTIRTLTLGSGNNNLYGLRDAINALGSPDPNVPGSKGLGVTATVINTGSGTNPYELVLTANNTGLGTTNGVVTISDVTSGGPVNSIGISAGTVDSMTSPTVITGGLTSTGSNVAQNAVFSVNGVQLTRTSNTVTDAVNGVTFTLKQGGQTGTTNFAVGIDTSTITGAMQDAVTKFNTLYNDYKTASAAGGALANDTTAGMFLQQVRAALTGTPSGLSASAPYPSLALLGVQTNQDGTLSLNTTAFQTALTNNPTAAQNVIANSGVSTNSAVSFYGLGQNTTTGQISFNITSYSSGGAVSGTFTVGGTNYTLSGTNGSLVGTAGTPLDGLILNVSGIGSGTLTVSRGVGQATQDLISSLTNYGNGLIPGIISNINSQNSTLASQIATGQERLNQKQTQLQAYYAQIESTIGQLQAMGQSLAGL